jgi:branched-chain amino acid transport system permease protein
MRERLLSIARVVVPIGLLLGYGFAISPYRVSLLTWGVVTGIAMLGIVVVTGISGQITLAQGAFVGLGGFGAAYLERNGLEYWVAVLVISLIALLIGALIALPALRLRGIFMAVGTIAVASFFYEFVFVQEYAAGSSGSVSFARPELLGLDTYNAYVYFVFSLVVFLLAAGVVHNMQRSHFGRALRALRDSEVGAATRGVNVTFYKLVAFAISAALGALSGGLLGPLLGELSRDNFTPFLGVTMLALCVVGGIESIWGALLAGLLLDTLPRIVGGSADSGFQENFQLFSAVALILGARFLPSGLLGTASQLWRRLSTAASDVASGADVAPPPAEDHPHASQEV